MRSATSSRSSVCSRRRSSCERACELTDVTATASFRGRRAKRGEQVTTFDTGERRRATDARPVIPDLIDEATVESIAGEAWVALVGEDEVLVPLPGELPAETVSAWVDVVGPWTGSVVLTTGRQTAADLSRALLGQAAPELLDHEDVADAFGEIANVVGGNVKAALPGPSTLGLPQVGEAPGVRNP